MIRSLRSALILAATAVLAGSGIQGASADDGWPQFVPAPGPQLLLVGHGAEMMQIVPRLAARVIEVGEPDADGNVYSFAVDIPDLLLNEIRSWRITFVSGELFAYVFQIRQNDGPQIWVTSLDGPLNGIAVGDGMLIEQTPVRRPTPQMQAATLPAA